MSRFPQYGEGDAAVHARSFNGERQKCAAKNEEQDRRVIFLRHVLRGHDIHQRQRQKRQKCGHCQRQGLRHPIGRHQDGEGGNVPRRWFHSCWCRQKQHDGEDDKSAPKADPLYFHGRRPIRES